MNSVKHLLRNVPYPDKDRMLTEGTERACAAYPDVAALFKRKFFDNAATKSNRELVVSLGIWLTQFSDEQIQELWEDIK